MHVAATSRKPVAGSNLGALWRGVVAALVAGIIGTIIHASLFYLENVPVFWGLAVAWLLLGLLVHWAAVASSRLWAGAIAFIGCYVVVGILMFRSNDRLITSLQYYQYMPGPAIASTLWVYGMIVPAIIGLLVALRAIRRAARS